MKTFLSLAFAVALVCFCSESFAQCPNSGGGGGGGGGQPSGGGGQGFASNSSRGGGSQGYSQPRLLTGPGSYFHDLMVQNYQQQQIQRRQAAIVYAKQVKHNTRKGKQLDTRRAQREAELARREEKKREAKSRQNVYDSNQVRFASVSR